MDKNNLIPSPCVRNCCLNENDICLGCFRSIEEIMRWSQAINEERAAIIRNAQCRRGGRRTDGAPGGLG